jgi:hypothetical protein
VCLLEGLECYTIEQNADWGILFEHQARTSAAGIGSSGSSKCREERVCSNVSSPASPQAARSPLLPARLQTRSSTSAPTRSGTWPWSCCTLGTTTAALRGRTTHKRRLRCGARRGKAAGLAAAPSAAGRLCVAAALPRCLAPALSH